MKSLFKLLTYIKYEWKTFSFGVLLLMLSVVAQLITPRIAQTIIDDVLQKNEVIALSFSPEFIRLLVLYGVVGIAGGLLRYFSTCALSFPSNKMTARMRNDVFAHVDKLPVSYFDSIPAGTVVSRITNDTEMIRTDFYVRVVSHMLVNLVFIVGLYIAIAMVHLQTFYILLPIIPFMAVFQYFYSRKAGKFQEEERKLNARINGQINELVKIVPVAQNFGQRKVLEERFRKLNDKNLSVRLRYLLFDMGMFCIPYRVSKLAVFLVVSVIAQQHLAGLNNMSIGTVYLIISYIDRLFGPMIMILDQMGMSLRARIAAERVFKLLDEKEEDNSDHNAEIREGDVSFKDVRFSYEQGVEILRGISFDVPAGSAAAFVGETGAGKSSLLNLLFRFYDPDSGHVSIDGEKIIERNRHSLRRYMGIVLQDPFIFQGTLFTNLTLDDPSISREKAMQALIDVGGDALLKRLPKGLDEVLSERGKTLSAGERQLISFARALAHDPKILVLDEATSSIDSETEQIIQHALNVVKEGRTTLMIAHRLSTVKDADRIYVMKQGLIVEEGTHESLVALGGIYSRMAKLQGMA